MLLALDVGNTNTVLGLYSADAGSSAKAVGKSSGLLAHWRVTTVKTQTVDEYGVLFRNLFAMSEIDVSGINGIIISSVVPPMDSTLREVCERYFQTAPMFVAPGVKTGMPVVTYNPLQV